MRRISSLFTLVLASLFLVQCQRELSHTGTPDPGVIVPQPLTATLQGNVVDENGQPASGVQIKVGSKTATTNASGYFRIVDAALDKVHAMVSAEKSGYFKAFRTFSATRGVNQVSIKLIPRTLAGTVNGATGGDATLANGGKVGLKANGVVNAATGAVYTGAVSVYAAYIDPSAADIMDVVPGSFMAIDKNGRPVTLTSYGMMAVELQGSNGEKLQVRTGFPASLTTPIPAGGQATAPASIPLWFVDEQTGLWKEEGTATKQGNVYVGDVAHFTFWNCDIPGPRVNVEFKLVTPNGQPLVHAYVKIRRQNQNGFGFAHGYSDSLGFVNGPVPANEPLVMEVLDQCGTVAFTQNIGPFAQNTNLGNITVPGSTAAMVTITGRLLTCSSTPVVNGYAVVSISNRVRYVRVDSTTGNFSLSFLACSGATAYSIFGVDATNMQQGNAITGTLSLPTTNVGNLTACGVSAQEFINYTLDGQNYSHIAPVDSLVAFVRAATPSPGWNTSINGNSMNTGSVTGINFDFISASQVAGSYPINNLRVRSFMQGNTPVAPFNVNVTNFATTVGQFFEGNLNGQFRDAQNNLHTLSATFRVRRAF